MDLPQGLPAHWLVVAWLVRVLHEWVTRRGWLVLGSEAKLAVGKARGRKPDVSVYRKTALPGLSDAVIRVAPHVVVEVTSHRARDVRRDRVEKLRDYAACAARYYWILDPASRTLEVLELAENGRYVHTLSAGGDAVARVPGCPGLRLTLDALWAEVDSKSERTPFRHHGRRRRGGARRPARGRAAPR